MTFKVPSNPNSSMILQFYENLDQTGGCFCRKRRVLRSLRVYNMLFHIPNTPPHFLPKRDGGEDTQEVPATLLHKRQTKPSHEDSEPQCPCRLFAAAAAEGPTPSQCPQCMAEPQCCSPLTWVVKIELAFECFGFLLRGEDPVEAVLAHNHHLLLAIIHLVLAQQLDNLGAH